MSSALVYHTMVPGFALAQLRKHVGLWYCLRQPSRDDTYACTWMYASWSCILFYPNDVQLSALSYMNSALTL